MTYHILAVGVAIFLTADASVCQTLPDASKSEPVSRHLLGLIPNYRTSPSLTNYEPLSVHDKFKVAEQDSFDRGTMVLGAIFGAQAQLSNSNRAFGQGAAGYGRYFGAAYGDFVIGNYMTEGIFPSLLHQDPRYFRRGTGGVWPRLGYAMGQIFMTHGDAGRKQFNYSEIVGNSASVAISNAYYASNRTAHDNVSQLSVQIGVDMAANILKEFYPDLERRFRRKHRSSDTDRK